MEGESSARVGIKENPRLVWNGDAWVAVVTPTGPDPASGVWATPLALCAEDALADAVASFAASAPELRPTGACFQELLCVQDGTLVTPPGVDGEAVSARLQSLPSSLNAVDSLHEALRGPNGEARFTPLFTGIFRRIAAATPNCVGFLGSLAQDVWGTSPRAGLFDVSLNDCVEPTHALLVVHHFERVLPRGASLSLFTVVGGGACRVDDVLALHGFGDYGRGACAERKGPVRSSLFACDFTSNGASLRRAELAALPEATRGALEAACRVQLLSAALLAVESRWTAGFLHLEAVLGACNDAGDGDAPRAAAVGAAAAAARELAAALRAALRAASDDDDARRGGHHDSATAAVATPRPRLPPLPPAACAACGRAGGRLFMCAGCRGVVNCGAACQASAWASHKAECRAARPPVSVLRFLTPV